MKLRVKNNSVRLRLTRSEVAAFGQTGHVEEAIEFGPDQSFSYALQISPDACAMRAALEENRITVLVPPAEALRWVATDQVSIASEQEIGEGKTLRLLIEKDFACLSPRPGEDDRDAFPPPASEKNC